MDKKDDRKVLVNKMIKVLAHRTVMKSPNDSIFAYFGWPSIGRLRDGRLAAVCSGFRYAHVCPFGKAVIAYSSDEGKTWTNPAPVIDTPLDDRDAGIMAFGENDVILTSFNNTVAEQLGWLRQKNRVEKSLIDLCDKDAAAKSLVEAYLNTITPEQEQKYNGSTYKLSHDGGVTWEDEVRRVPLSAPHGPVLMRDGRLLYVGKLFDPNDSRYPQHGCEVGAMVSRDGITWTEPVFIPAPEGMMEDHYLFCEPHAIELPSGKILVHIRTQKQHAHGNEKIFAIYQSESLDGGKTFSVPVCVNPCGSPPHLMLHSSGALICSYGYRSVPYGQRVMISYDEGKTWQRDLILRDDGPNHDLGYPATVELKNGNLLTVYYQRPTIDAPSCIYATEWKL